MATLLALMQGLLLDLQPFPAARAAPISCVGPSTRARSRRHHRDTVPCRLDRECELQGFMLDPVPWSNFAQFEGLQVDDRRFGISRQRQQPELRVHARRQDVQRRRLPDDAADAAGPGRRLPSRTCRGTSTGSTTVSSFRIRRPASTGSSRTAQHRHRGDRRCRLEPYVRLPQTSHPSRLLYRASGEGDRGRDEITPCW